VGFSCITQCSLFPWQQARIWDGAGDPYLAVIMARIAQNRASALPLEQSCYDPFALPPGKVVSLSHLVEESAPYLSGVVAYNSNLHKVARVPGLFPSGGSGLPAARRIGADRSIRIEGCF
jgi:hypothetical protein